MAFGILTGSGYSLPTALFPLITKDILNQSASSSQLPPTDSPDAFTQVRSPALEFADLGRAPVSAPVNEIQKLHIAEKKPWLFLVFEIGGHGLAGDFERMNKVLAKRGTSKDAHIAVRAEDASGRLVNLIAETVDDDQDGLLDLYASGPDASKYLKRPILDKDAIASFLTEAVGKLPSDHICVSFEGHSGQLRQVITEIHAALKELTEKLGRKIDILVFDSCFMAQVEIATEFADVAKFLAASQEGVVKFRSYPKVAKLLNDTTTPEDLAKQIALNNQEFTFSSTDLEKMPELNRSIKALGEVILKISDNKALAEIRTATKKATGYYTEGFFTHNHFNNTIDFRGFVTHISESPYLRKYFPQLVTACSDVLKIFGNEGSGVVLAERHAIKEDIYYLDHTDVNGSHGLSIHQPITPAPFINRYTHLKNSRFNEETNWDAVSAHITSTRTPWYLTASFAKWVSGYFTAGVNNGLQRVFVEWPLMQKLKKIVFRK